MSTLENRNILNKKNILDVRRKDMKHIQKNKPYSKNRRICTIIKIIKFFNINEFANMIGISFLNIKQYCLSINIIIKYNNVVDIELLTILAYKYGYIIDIIINDIYSIPKTHIGAHKKNRLCNRPPIVAVMGHIDHGKTSLIDYIRKSNIIKKEAGNITQHIGVYSVELKKNKYITLIDTPGHEAFLSMRAKGVKITDIIIIVIDVTDNVMPQTKEAISQAITANLPMIFAFNKIDLPTAQPEKIRKQLADLNITLEEWGGKYQTQEISTKTGKGIEKLLEKIWLEVDTLDLKADPFKAGSGSIIESSLDKEKGYINNILVQDGTIKIGDYIYSGNFNGKIKAIYNQDKVLIHNAGPSSPVYILGLDGPALSGDIFNVSFYDKDVKKKYKKTNFKYEQNYKIQEHISLNEIDRKMTLSTFNEINIVLKGDVVGSIEALTTAFQKISAEKVSINIIYKGIGMISESDILLASVSHAIIVGFNVKSALNISSNSKYKNIDIRFYSVIYDAINDIKKQVNLMNSLNLHEKTKIIGRAEIRNIYYIKKIYIIAGCMVTYGKIYRHSKIKLLREGIVLHKGELSSLKRFKEDVKEVAKGYECGVNIKDYTDIKVGDIIELF